MRLQRWIAATAVVWLCLLAPRPAVAVSGLAWQLDDTSVRYFMEAEVLLPEVMWLKAEVNKEVRISLFRIRVVTRCEPVERRGKRGWELACDIEQAAVSALPMESGRADHLAVILAELDERYEAGEIQLVFNRDGRIRDVDLEGVDKHNPRLIEIHETMRLMLVRALATLDLRLPRKGDDKGKGRWKQSDATAMAFPSPLGTQGSSRLVHEVVGTEGDVVALRTTGRGTLGSGETIVVNGAERPKNLFDMTIEGGARFDTERGLLLERAYSTEGTPTASSVASDGAAGYPYVQSARLFLLGDEDAPDVGESAVIDLEAERTAAEEPPPAAPDIPEQPRATSEEGATGATPREGEEPPAD